MIPSFRLSSGTVGFYVHWPMSEWMIDGNGTHWSCNRWPDRLSDCKINGCCSVGPLVYKLLQNQAKSPRESTRKQCRLVKGQSGNPGGRPKDELGILRACASSWSRGALKTLRATAWLILRRRRLQESQASVAIPDRGFGKPTQLIGGDAENPIVYEEIRRVLVGSDLRDQDSADIRPATH